MKYIKYFLLFLLAGCAPKFSNIGWEYFYNQEFERGVEFFSKGIQKDSSDYDAIKGLGLSYLMLNDFQKAERYIQKGMELKPDDPENIFSLALYYSLHKEADKSIYFFEKFLSISPESNLREDANKLLIAEKKKYYQAELKNVIENEKRLSEIDYQKNSIAVLPFNNVGESGEYDVLEKGIADQTISYIGYLNNVKALERLRIDELFKEINLSGSAVIEKSSAIRAGKLLRAEKLLTGNYSISQDNNLKLKMYFVTVKEGLVSEEVSGEGKLDDFFEIHKETFLSILEKMKIGISDETRKKILTYKTEDIFEFISYLRKKYFEESETLVIGNWLSNRINAINSSPISNIMNVSQISIKPEIKSTIMPMQSPDLETPPALPK